MVCFKFLIYLLVKPAARVFNVSPNVARYWKHKLQNPDFHSSQRGGARNVKFNDEEFNEYGTHLWNLAKTNPGYKLITYASKLRLEHGIEVSVDYIRRTFKSWRWSWQICDPKQKNKFSLENIR